MPIFITQADYSTAVGVNRDTASRRFAGLPFEQVAGGPRRYPLASVLPTIKPTERASVPALIAASTVVPNLYVGPVIVATAMALEAFLLPAESRRLFECRVHFTASLASLASGDLMLWHERLRLALGLHHAVLLYVLGATTADMLPDWGRFGPAFCITNCVEEDLLRANLKESA